MIPNNPISIPQADILHRQNQTALANINQPMFMMSAGRAKKNIVTDIGNASTKLAIKKMVTESIMIWMALITPGAYLTMKLVFDSTCDIEYD